MRLSKIFNVLYIFINILLIALIIYCLSPLNFTADAWLMFTDVPYGSVTTFVILYIIFIYTCGLISAKEKNDTKEKWEFVKKITSYKKNKVEQAIVVGSVIFWTFLLIKAFCRMLVLNNTINFSILMIAIGIIIMITMLCIYIKNKECLVQSKTKNVYEIDERILIIMVMTIIFLVLSLANLRVSMLMLIIVLLYTIIASTCIDMIKYKKIVWKFKDFLAAILVLIFVIAAAIIFIITYNTIGEAGMFNTPPVYAAMYYIEASIIPWILFNIYTYIRIKEFKKKEKLAIETKTVNE